MPIPGRNDVCSNSETVAEEVESYAKSATHIPGSPPATKPLGMHWNKREDQMFLDVKEVVEDKHNQASYSIDHIYDL